MSKPKHPKNRTCRHCGVEFDWRDLGDKFRNAWTCSEECRDARRAQLAGPRGKQWREENRERHNASERRRRAADPNARRKAKAYRQRDPQKWLAYDAAYQFRVRDADREAYNAKARERRAANSEAINARRRELYEARKPDGAHQH